MTYRLGMTLAAFAAMAVGASGLLDAGPRPRRQRSPLKSIWFPQFDREVVHLPAEEKPLSKRAQRRLRGKGKP